MDHFTQANRDAWNIWLARDIHSSHHQDVARFQRTGSSLRSIERQELTDVAGKSLLHLLCNMGSETLSWARLGATVTGVDLSDAAIQRARELASESGLAGRFIQADVYQLPEVLDERFDIVFMSYGVLFWLADIPRWAALVARYLNPDGVLYVVDMHPLPMMFGASRPEPTGRDFHVAHPYTSSATPAQSASGADAADAADPAASEPADSERIYCWNHGLGEVLTALIAAGMRIDFLHEFPFQHYQQFPSLVRDEEGWWRWPSADNSMPLLFSLHATRRAQ